MQTENYVRGGTQKDHYSTSETCEWPCPLCGKQKDKLIKEERGALKVVQCKSCELIRVNPRLKQPDEIYHGDPEIYTEEFRMILSGQAPHHRDPNYRKDLEIIEKYKPTGNFLDIGANVGSFLRLARDRGWKLTGVEPSTRLAKLAREWWGLHIEEGFIESLDLPTKHYDVVTMTDVFEHIVNPKEVLEAVRHVIKPDGLLFIKVPNALFNVFKFRVRSLLGNKEADDFDSYEHVIHYTDKTLKKMLQECAFEPFSVWVERPIQIPVWHKLVGHYYQHKSPFLAAWKTYSARNVLFQAARIENTITRRIGSLAPNIGCLARPATH